jgi:hypothetical protein
MRQFAAPVLLLGLALAGFAFSYRRPDPSRAADVAAIEKLVQDYFAALRRSDFDGAASHYAPLVRTAIAASGSSMEKALRGATEISGGIPDAVKIEALRFDEANANRATAELVVPERASRSNPVGNYHLVDLDANKDFGIYARTLHFVKVKDEWKIGAGKSIVEEKAANEALQTVQQLRRQQQDRR